MGRWAQAKRRGGLGAPPAALGPPPAPTLTGDISQLIQHANCSGNEGGSLALYVTTHPGGALSQVGAHEWVDPWDWGELYGQDGMYATCRQVGNDIVFTGPSELSNYVYLVQ